MIEIQTNLSGDFTSGLEALEKKVQEEVLISGVAAMAKVIHDEVKLNTSGAGVVKRDKDFVGPMQPGPPGRVTGNLHNAVYRIFSPERSTADTKIYHVSVNKKKAPHWWMVEYGTSKMAPRSYLRRSLSRMRDAAEAGMKRMREKL